MSLKVFHIIFIILATLLAAAFAAWTFVNQTATGVGVGSAIGAVLLVAYGVWFVRKSRHIIT
jgi:hypothetical protein